MDTPKIAIRVAVTRPDEPEIVGLAREKKWLSDQVLADGEGDSGIRHGSTNSD